VAAVMMEPARSELPPVGYLEEVRRLTTAHDVVLIFDEVSCGWRPALGGMQEMTGVIPDVTVVAKAMSNGYPMGAVVGKRAVMEAASVMFISSSYWSDNIGLIAALTTLAELKRRNAVAYLNEVGEKLRAAVNSAIQDAGLQGACAGIAANPYFSLTLPSGADRRKVNTLFIQEMARHGIHTLVSFKATLAHGDDEIAATRAAATAACHVIRRALDEGDLDKYLVADVKKEPFRRLVR
jgi:glutamate-1-semialdehyde 2,1-aminomutase